MDKIIKNFDSSVPAHVEWLKLIHDAAKKMDATWIEKVSKKNPFGVTIKPVDIPEIQFVLDAKYVDSIFEKKAHIL
jgi:hypothetical protein